MVASHELVAAFAVACVVFVQCGCCSVANSALANLALANQAVDMLVSAIVVLGNLIPANAFLAI